MLQSYNYSTCVTSQQGCKQTLAVLDYTFWSSNHLSYPDCVLIICWMLTLLIKIQTLNVNITHFCVAVGLKVVTAIMLGNLVRS